MPTIKMNFIGEWAQQIEAGLAAAGYRVPAGLSHDELCHRYLNLQRRLVKARPREVVLAAEFSCPRELTVACDSLRDKIVRGEDLRPHLSRGLIDLDTHDMLLNDWGIHHLHLGSTLEPDGFVERTGPVLFVRFTNDTAYAISVLKHGSWARQEFVKVLHRNWPTTIPRYRLHGIVGLEPVVSDEDIASLRGIKVTGQKKRAAVSTFIEVEPGVVYAPIGGGYSTAQTSIVVVRDCDRLLETLREYEDRVRANVAAVVEQAKARGVDVPEELSFKLRRLEDGGVVAIEEYTSSAILLSSSGA